MKLRSKIPRRKRTHISPILCSNISRSIASSHLTREEVSCDSSRVSANRPQAASLKKRGFADTVSAVAEREKVGGEDFRRITRSYYRKRENENAKVLEVSESSCVEPCSGANTGERISKLKSKTGKVAESSKEINQSEGFSRVQQFSGKILRSERENEKGAENSLDNNQTEVVSVTSGLESLSEAKFGKLSGKIIKMGQNRDELSEVSRNCDTLSNSESNTERIPKLIGAEFDLACSENLSCEEACDNEHSSVSFSDLQSDVFEDFSSDLDFSDYNSSLWCDSGSQFSERSVNGTSPSPTYQMLLQFRQQFCRSSSSALRPKVNSPDEVILLRFEDEEHEESYQMIRYRERKQLYLHDYAEEYCSMTEYGELVIQQRLQMVHWIIEQSSNKEFQRETTFLGVNLFDRFLSNGHFKNKRNLQIAAIACLTLATRIEENQPYNSVRQRTFYVGSNTYSRCEVVAMEWLVQEVLHFQCYLPTMYNFLWFYLKAARANEEMEKSAKYIAVLALLGHEQLCYWPSTVAAGLVILASLAANQDAACHRVTETHVRTKDDDLPGCVKSLERLIRYIS